MKTSDQSMINQGSSVKTTNGEKNITNIKNGRKMKKKVKRKLPTENKQVLTYDLTNEKLILVDQTNKNTTDRKTRPKDSKTGLTIRKTQTRAPQVPKKVRKVSEIPIYELSEKKNPNDIIDYEKDIEYTLLEGAQMALENNDYLTYDQTNSSLEKLNINSNNIRVSLERGISRHENKFGDRSKIRRVKNKAGMHCKFYF